jgi:hypothetical protein
LASASPAATGIQQGDSIRWQAWTSAANDFFGVPFPIGIEVGVDGSIGFGVNRLPVGMVLARRVGAAS